MTQNHGLGCALAQVRHTSQSSFHPAHHNIGVDIKGSPGYPLSCNLLLPSGRNHTYPSLPETQEEGMGLPWDGS